MTENFKALINELVCDIDTWNTASTGIIIPLMQLERLDRIADALEGIDEKLAKFLNNNGIISPHEGQ